MDEEEGAAVSSLNRIRKKGEMKKIKFIFIVIFSSGQAEVSPVLTGDSIEAPGQGKQKVIWPKEKN